MYNVLFYHYQQNYDEFTQYLKVLLFCTNKIKINI